MKNKVISILLLTAIIFTLLPAGVFSANTITYPCTGTVNASALVVRSGPGTSYSQLKNSSGGNINLYSGTSVTVLGIYACNDGTTAAANWYNISFSSGGVAYTGYAASQYITIPTSSTPTPGETLTFEESLQYFPESYHAGLRALHELHPNWIFTALDTGITWATVNYEENRLGRSLTDSREIANRSTAAGAYDWTTDKWIPLDASNWFQASEELVAYYLDPRNFLTERYIFQFESLSYRPLTQTISGVERIISGSFMANNSIDANGYNKTYAEVFMMAAAESQVSPYHLAARVIQEVGYSGSGSVSGTYPGYEGFYNYYNIGASSSSTPIANGLKYAKDESNTGTFMRPWNTRYKAIVGGAKWIGNSYINVGQNTLYLQKWDVTDDGNGRYWHQYMTNVAAAASESTKMYNAYNTMGIIDDRSMPIEFIIPVYRDMPAATSAYPTPADNPNNWLSSLSVNGYSLSPAFSMSESLNNFSISLDRTVTSIYVNASKVSTLSSISGDVGTISLTPGQTQTLNIKCTAKNGNVRNYYITINWTGCSHEWIEATCQTPRTCRLCGETQGEVGAHTYIINVIAPTCQAPGYTLHTCSLCKTQYMDQQTEKLPHTGGTATCIEKAVCEVCGDEYGDFAAHDYSVDMVVEPTCEEGGYTKHVCSLCSDYYESNLTQPLGHIGGEATCTQRPTCERCNELYGNTTIHHFVDGICEDCQLNENEIKYGDVNNDGFIDDIDIMLLERYLALWKIELNITAADINGDSEIDDIDAMLFTRYLAGWEVETKIQEVTIG